MDAKQPVQEDDLKTLFPDFEAQTRSGPIPCNPFGLEQFAKVGQILKKYAERLTSLQGEVKLADLALQLLAEGGDVATDCLTLMSLSTGKSTEELQALRGDEQFSVLAMVLEANLDFFTRRIAPAIRNMLALFGLSPIQQPSLALSEPAGDGPISEE